MIKPLLVLLSIMVLTPAPVAAQAKPPTNKVGGITISPASQELLLTPGQTAIGGSFAVANNSDTAQTFELSVIDMGALDETGGVLLSGLSHDYRKKYGLTDWLTLSQPALTIPPRNKSTVTFSIKNDDALRPGGHYGAIVVRPAGNTARPSERVALLPQAASLLFLRKVGGEKYGLSLPTIHDNHSVWQLPTKVTLPFRNDGNVHVVPRGIVQLKNTFGKEIARGIINSDSSLVLPERTRNLSVPLTSQVRTVWPGRYTIEVEYRYDGQEKVAIVSTSFYTANLRVLVLITGVVLAVGFVVYKLRRRIRRVFHKVKRLAVKFRSKMRR